MTVLRGAAVASPAIELLPIFSFVIASTRRDGQGSAGGAGDSACAQGEALLIDWGYLWTVEEDGRRRKLWAFIGVLGYSRYMVVRLMTCCDQPHTLATLAKMYDEMGGVPRRARLQTIPKSLRFRHTGTSH